MNQIVDNPLVSVIIPVYNCEPYLAQAVTSALTQTYKPVEVIIIDDSSADNSATIAKSFDGVQYFCQAHAGAGSARNHGVSLAKGDYIAFLDGDDIWEPNKLDVQMGYMLADPEIQYTLTHMNCFLEPGVAVPYGFRRELLDRDTPGHVTGTLLVRKEVFVRVGEFDSILYPAEDVDWFCRAADKGVLSVMIPEVLLRKRIHGSNITNNVDKNNENLLWVLKQSVARKRQKRAAADAKS